VSHQAPERSGLDSYRDDIEESGGASGRDVEHAYFATIARINQIEIDRLNQKLELSRQGGSEGERPGGGLAGLLRESWAALLEEHWPQVVLLSVVAIVLALAWLLAQAIG
jgi:hypothetical protein